MISMVLATRCKYCVISYTGRTIGLIWDNYCDSRHPRSDKYHGVIPSLSKSIMNWMLWSMIGCDDWNACRHDWHCVTMINCIVCYFCPTVLSLHPVASYIWQICRALFQPYLKSCQLNSRDNNLLPGKYTCYRNIHNRFTPNNSSVSTTFIYLYSKCWSFCKLLRWQLVYPGLGSGIRSRCALALTLANLI